MNILQAIRERRSIGFFDPERTIPAGEIKKIIEDANLAPSSFNLQPWEVVVVDDPARKKALRKCSFNQPKVEEASAVLIMIANPNAVEENIDEHLKSWVELGYIKQEEVQKMREAPFGMYGEKDSPTRKFFAVKNTAFFAMNFMLAARGLGYETHPMDGFSEGDVKKEFGIPEDRIIPLLVAVGFIKPGQELLPRAFRRKIEVFTKFNKF